MPIHKDVDYLIVADAVLFFFSPSWHTVGEACFMRELLGELLGTSGLVKGCPACIGWRSSRLVFEGDLPTMRQTNGIPVQMPAIGKGMWSVIGT